MAMSLEEGLSIEISYDDEWWAGRVKKVAKSGVVEVTFNSDGSKLRVQPEDVSNVLRTGGKALEPSSSSSSTTTTSPKKKKGKTNATATTTTATATTSEKAKAPAAKTKKKKKSSTKKLGKKQEEAAAQREGVKEALAAADAVAQEALDSGKPIVAADVERTLRAMKGVWPTQCRPNVAPDSSNGGFVSGMCLGLRASPSMTAWGSDLFPSRLRERTRAG